MAVPSYRAPLLWLLLPLVMGYILGYHLPNVQVVPGLALSLVALTVAWKSSMGRQTSRAFHWAPFFITGVSIASLLYFQNQREFPKIWEKLPPREANLELKVKRLFASKDPTLISGIATIANTEEHLKPLRNHSLYFSLNTDGQFVDRGYQLSVNGVLDYLPAKKSLTPFEKYLQAQSVPLSLTRAYLRNPPRVGNAMETLIGKLRSKAIHSLGIQLEDHPDARSVYRGMMLGIKGELSTENKLLFLRTGTLHLFAISGLHVGIVAVSWAGIFLLLRIPKKVAVIPGLLLVYLYVETTGASPSAVRAFAMTAFFWAGRSLVRQMPPFQALVASAITVLLISPAQLFSSGFQLSYTVVSGILLWGAPLYQALREAYYARIERKQQFLTRSRKFLNKLWEFTASTFCISLSATLASAPLSIQYFGLFAPLAVFLNMILVPLASLVIVSGLFSMIGGYLFLPPVSAFFNHGPLLIIHVTSWLLEKVVSAPMAFLVINWKYEWLGFSAVILFVGSLLAGHGLRLPNIWRFAFPVVITGGLMFINSLL